MNAAGIAVAILGVMIVTQIVAGKALERLGFLR